MKRPLENIQVLDLTTTIAGPYCSRLLADIGAAVIKIESPEGEISRDRPPLRQGASTSYGQLNAGKRSIALDLKSPGGKDILRRLVAGADVLVENFRPGVMARFGLGYEALRAINPRLIYCAISGYGQTGPSSSLAAYAPAIHASSGYELAHMDYQEGRVRPDNCGIYTADVLSGTFAFGAIMTAMVQRHATGEGQMIDVSMLETMLGLTLSEVQLAQFPQPKAAKPLFGPVATLDGFIMPAIASERTFQNLARAVGRQDWITDPRFEVYTNRRANWGELIDELEVWTATRTSAECQAAMDATGVPCSPYRTVKELFDDPQLAHREAFAEIHDAGGSFKVVNPPFRMSAAKVAVNGFVTGLGENTREVLLELGYGAAAADGLIASGAARAA